jgi:hypothetical protein
MDVDMIETVSADPETNFPLKSSSIGGLAGLTSGNSPAGRGAGNSPTLSSTNSNSLPEYLKESPLVSLLSLGEAQTSLETPSSLRYIPLPNAWNPKDKCNLLELQRSNLRVNYMGL